MDEDIHDHLVVLSRHIEAIGRQVKSTKIDLTGLIAMKETLSICADTLQIYINMQLDRYNS